jgi:hypothetical protein
MDPGLRLWFLSVALSYRGFDPVAEASPRYRAQPPDLLYRSLLVLSGVDASGVEGPVFSSAFGK